MRASLRRASERAEASRLRPMVCAGELLRDSALALTQYRCTLPYRFNHQVGWRVEAGQTKWQRSVYHG